MGAGLIKSYLASLLLINSYLGTTLVSGSSKLDASSETLYENSSNIVV
jgi:hypothetical protein